MKSDSPIRPFFIVGSPRSGTTLLRFMLSSHSRLYVPDETGFLPFLHYDAQQILTAAEVNKILQRIGRLNRLWKDLVADPIAFRDDLFEPRLPYLLDALYRLQSEPYGAIRWGDKTPLYGRYIPQLLAIFPCAQFIHVIRDGRDATLSAKVKWGSEKWYMDTYYLLRNWQDNVKAGEDARYKLANDQYISLRYEELVTNPGATLVEVCRFLGESFEANMINQAALARKVGGGIDAHVEAQSEIHTLSIERWRREMTPFEKKLADVLIGETLAELGYELAGRGPMTVSEQVRKTYFAIKYVMTSTARSLLYRMGIYTLNRNRR